MNRLFSFRIDFVLLISSILLVMIGLSALYSIDVQYFKQQLLFFILSLGVYCIFTQFNYQSFGAVSKFVYVGIIISLILVLFLGTEAKGAVRWVHIFGVSFQISEIVKPIYILILAHFLTRDSSVSLVKFLLSFILLAPIFFLILKQPDLGSAMIFAFTTGFMLLTYGFPIRYFLGLGIAFLIPMPFFFSLLHEYQKQRILSFLNMSEDPFGSSYNAIQSLISIGSGRFFGKGFGESTQSILQFLPEQHTDFIFATVSENLGFVGGIVLLILYSILMVRMYIQARSSSSSFAYISMIGIYFLFLTQIFFNIGMNIGILPIVGITLPFISYGGSSLLTKFMMLGIFTSLAYSHKNKEGMEIR